MRFSACGEYSMTNGKKERFGTCVFIHKTQADKGRVFEALIDKVHAKWRHYDMYYELGYPVCMVHIDDEELDEFKQFYLKHKREWRNN